MDYEFPAAFQEALSDKLGIVPEDVVDTLRFPDQSEDLIADDLRLSFHTKMIPQHPHPYISLAYGQPSDDRFRVRMAWKLYPSLGEQVTNLSPLELLRTFAGEYGLPVIIGEEERRFYLDETIRVDSDDAQNAVTIRNPVGHEYVEQIIAKTERCNGYSQVRCALGLCINIDKYRTWTAQY